MKKLLIANRGEIARRVMRAAKKRAMSVAVIATAEDSDSLVCAEADAVLTVSSYLNGTEIVSAAKSWGADAIHPGYGFLSENAEFAAAVEAAKIIFIGPTSENIRSMGSKESAKTFASDCNVPVLSAVYSSEIKNKSISELEQLLKQRFIKSPYLVKASAGGGGRGMRVVEKLSDLPAAIERGSAEALASFKDGTVFIESFLQEPRHIEIQVFGDGLGGGVFVGERECSLQRRHQKVIEEAPSSVVDEHLRERMGKAALSLVKKTKYRGAGTAEFLLDKDKNFYFLEMNTRLQVEHPVTEWVFGVDLVDAQIDLASGLWPAQLGNPNEFFVRPPHGVALEARILAEDPRNNYLPTPGPLLRYCEPTGEGVRVDSGVLEGGRVNPNFDSMISKLIVYGESRAVAVKRLSKALSEYVVLGTTTNIPFLQAIARHSDFLEGNESTHWLGTHIESLNRPLLPDELMELFNSNGFAQRVVTALQKPSYSGFSERFATQSASALTVKADDKNLYVSGPALVSCLKTIASASCDRFSPAFCEIVSRAKAVVSGSHLKQELVLPYFVQRKDHKILLSIYGEFLSLPLAPDFDRASAHAGGGEVRAPMAGKVLEVRVKPGDSVAERQVVCVVESMKMQLEVFAPVAGVVEDVFVQAGQVLTGPDLIAKVKSSS